MSREIADLGGGSLAAQGWLGQHGHGINGISSCATQMLESRVEVRQYYLVAIAQRPFPASKSLQAQSRIPRSGKNPALRKHTPCQNP
jgi:hypothetical protein